MQKATFNKTHSNKNIDIDDIIDRIMKLQFNSSTVYFPLTENQIQALCSQTREIIATQPMLLELKPPINICGDTHGQFHDLLKLIKTIGTPEKENYLFLGDYVDRGKRSLECFCLLMAFKIKYPNNFFLLRGNHQCSEVNKMYGFYDQVKRKFNIKLWKTVCNVFNYLPLAAVVGDRIFCIHGGLSPQLKDVRDINVFKRPIEPYRSSPMSDMLWSDPSPVVKDWAQNLERGISYYFGTEVIDKFLKKHDFDFICRSHQVIEEGYQFFHDRKLLTIFSAPNYCGEFQNLAAVLKVDKNMKCSIEQLNPNADFKIHKVKRALTPLPICSKDMSFYRQSTSETVSRKKQHTDSPGKENQISQIKRTRMPQLQQNRKKTPRKMTNGRILRVKETEIHQCSFEQTFDF